MGRREDSLGAPWSRTKRDLWEGLVLCLERLPFAEVRIADICEAAMLHRLTFYRHFEDKADLLERGSLELLDRLAAEADRLSGPGLPGAEGGTLAWARYLMSAVEGQEPVLRLLLRDGGPLGARLRDYLDARGLERLAAAFGRPASDERLRFIARCATSSVFSAIEWRLEGGDGEEVAAALSAILLGGTSAALEPGKRRAAKAPGRPR